jgi:hypothetical protein
MESISNASPFKESKTDGAHKAGFLIIILLLFLYEKLFLMNIINKYKYNFFFNISNWYNK